MLPRLMIVAILALAIPIVLAAETATLSPAQLAIPICSQAPVVDGRMDDLCWKVALERTGFFDIQTGRPAEVQTTVRMCRDAAWLYLALRCTEPDCQSMLRRTSRRDGAVTTDDSVEVFIDNGHAGKQYIHLMLNAANVQADQICAGEQRKRYWTLPWRSAVLVDPRLDAATGWSAEMAVPLFALQAGAGPHPWRLNVCRNRRAVTPVVHSSMAPLPMNAGFHAPECFAPILGLDTGKAETVFAPIVADTQIQPYEIAAGRYAYRVKVGLKNEGGKGGEALVCVEDRPLGKAASETRLAVELQPIDARDVSVRVPVEAPGPRSAILTLSAGRSESPLCSMPLAGLERLTPFEAYLDRNYYTAEKTAVIYVEHRLCPEERREERLEISAVVRDESERVALETRGISANENPTPVALALADLKPGCYVVTVSVAGRAGRLLGETRLTLVKRESAPAGVQEVKVDRHNRCWLLNGRPYFPVGSFFCTLPAYAGFDLEKNRSQWEYAREAGFNMVIDWAGFGEGAPVEQGLKRLDLAQEHGLRVVGLPAAYGKGQVYYDHSAFREGVVKVIQSDGLADFVRRAARHPATIGYYQLDEPPDFLPGAGLTIDEILKLFYERVHALDPYHPVYLSLCRTIGNPAWFETVADVVGTHNYWLPWEPESLNHEAMWAEQVDRHARRAHGPTMIAVNSENRGALTVEERRAMVYLSLVHGARSLIYFAQPIEYRITLDGMKALAPELAALAPVLTSPDLRQESTFEPAQAFMRGWDETLNFPWIQTLLKPHPDGGQVLLAVNATFQPIRVRFSVSSLGPRSAVRDYFTQAEYAVKDGTWTDEFEPLARRVYFLQGTRRVTDDAPARIHVALSGAAVEAAAAPGAPPVSGEMHRNLVTNPGFDSEGNWETGKTWRRTNDQNYAGRAVMRADKLTAAGFADLLSDPLELKPDTRYRFGGRLRCKVAEGRRGPYFFIYDVNTVSSGKNRLNVSGPSAALDTAAWALLTGEFTTPVTPPVTARLWCRVEKDNVGWVEADDVFVEEIGAVATRKNLAVNSSFEQARLPGIEEATHWNGSGWGYLKPDPRACGTDTNAPWHGKVCWRITTPFPGAYGAYAYLTRPIALKAGTAYAFSAYLKAEKSNTRVRLTALGKQEDVTVGTEWTRYAIPLRTPAEDPKSQYRHTTLMIRHYGAGNLYVDAVQFEEGPEPTAYAE